MFYIKAWQRKEQARKPVPDAEQASVRAANDLMSDIKAMQARAGKKWGRGEARAMPGALLVHITCRTSLRHVLTLDHCAAYTRAVCKSGAL